MTKRITAPFSSSLRSWSPTKCSTFYMKQRLHGTKIKKRASTLWHPCLPYRVSPLAVSKSGENTHNKRHPMPHASLVALRITRWHALAHRLGSSSSSQAHLNVRYRLIQSPTVETSKQHNNSMLGSDKFRTGEVYFRETEESVALHDDFASLWHLVQRGPGVVGACLENWTPDVNAHPREDERVRRRNLKKICITLSGQPGCSGTGQYLEKSIPTPYSKLH